MALRLKWQQYLDWRRNGGGDVSARPHTAEVVLDAIGQVKMRASRIGAKRVRDAVEDWVGFAQVFYAGGDEPKYDRQGELLRWTRIETYSGEEARSIDNKSL